MPLSVLLGGRNDARELTDTASDAATSDSGGMEMAGRFGNPCGGSEAAVGRLKL